MENETSIIELLTTFTVLFIIYILTRKFCIFYNISVNYYINNVINYSSLSIHIFYNHKFQLNFYKYVIF
jgi:hypothetical protein